MTIASYITVKTGETPIAGVSPVIYEIERSRFLSYVRHAEEESDVRVWLEEIRKKHFDARHMPYAFVCGASAEKQRSSDDSEPGGTAGSPILEVIKARGITVLTAAAPQHIEDSAAETTVVVRTSVGEQSISADAVLLATGRKPNTEGLNLAAAEINVTPRGAVAVDAHLQTNVPHIWAMGDVTGGLQFTYISLDDFRIVRDQLVDTGARTTENRGAVPYTVFLDPPLSRVGMTEDEARAAGYDVRVLKLEAAAVPKAQVLRNPVGLLKAIVDTKTDKVLGAHFFCPGSEEMINLMKLAIDAGITAHTLGQSIYNHPTMSEALNDLFV